MREMVQAIKDVLLHEWDPIGVCDEPKASDEYDAYIGPLMKSAKRDVNAVSDLLLIIERSRMGLPGDQDRATRVAESIIAVVRRLATIQS
ncbi:MAG: hypothetical protein JWL93_633 [Hyphomicrobiales bacterium]|jgi:hypothetical protein|nr:hypothetical protein [Hyphomicrobiales bacterium]